MYFGRDEILRNLISILCCVMPCEYWFMVVGLDGLAWIDLA